MNIIPKPRKFTVSDGQFLLEHEATIAWSGPGAQKIAELLADYLSPATGFNLNLSEGSSGTIKLVAEGESSADEAGFVDETYSLRVHKDGVELSAPNATGLARGIQTLRQLFPPSIFESSVQKTSWALPLIHIEDTPKFRWRGQHLDVCRHFFNVEEVCKFIDTLALHRLNICHIHLTEDQGWRIEIKQYPRLTEVGSVRKSTLIGHHSQTPRCYDNQPYGGFYTQDDIKTIVQFASRRHITLVPEIDMPGHMVAAITAYPELGNFKSEVNVRCHWGISQQILNVEDATVDFMKNVLTEVMELFPGQFIHIGGDEAPKHEWSESHRAQERMAQLQLKNEHELQSWFIRQMGDHISSAGRRLIGWDEILEGGLAEGAAVMSWRGLEGGLAAAAQGNDVVMAPQQHLYFDYYQDEKNKEYLAIGGMTKLDEVYSYHPIPEAMPESQHHHVLGAQGQLWTEYMGSMDIVERMGFPRICALAELLWLDQDEKDYNNFLKRLIVHRKRLDALDLNTYPNP